LSAAIETSTPWCRPVVPCVTHVLAGMRPGQRLPYGTRLVQLQQTWQIEVKMERLLEESPGPDRDRRLDQDRIRPYAEVLDHNRQSLSLSWGDQTVLLADGHQ
jgi:hypothetical protein